MYDIILLRAIQTAVTFAELHMTNLKQDSEP